MKVFKCGSRAPRRQPCTLIYMINPKSGARIGAKLIEQVQKKRQVGNIALHAFNLLDFTHRDEQLRDDSMMELTEILEKAQNVRVIVGGGDGTSKWVVEILTEILGMHEIIPPVVPMAMGTGNELGFVTGWGHAFKWSVAKYSKLVQKGEVCRMDTWDVSIKYIDNNNQFLAANQQDPIEEQKLDMEDPIERNDELFGDLLDIPVDGLKMKMTCFFSCGLDAAIGMRYHIEREAETDEEIKKKSLAAVKAKHVYWGIQEMFQDHPSISEIVTVTVDGVECQIPQHCGNLMIFNIHTSAGGSYHWGRGKSNRKDARLDFQKPLVNDGLLEVAGLESVKHSFAVRLNASHARRIGQGHQICLEFRQPVNAQLDGEPWIQPAGSRIEFTFAEQIDVVCGPNRTLNF